MSSKIKFTNLHSHTTFSTFDGLGYPAEHYDYAYENGMDAMAITDHGNMNSLSYCLEHIKKMKKEGKDFKPIFGIEAYFVDSVSDWKVAYDKERENKKAKSKKASADEKNGTIVEDEDSSKSAGRTLRSRAHLVLLAKNEVGLKNIFSMISQSYKSPNFYYYPRIDFDLLRKHSEGVIVSTACLGGPLSKIYWNNSEESDEKLVSLMLEKVNKFKEILGDDFYGEIQWNRFEEQHKVNKLVIETCRQANVEIISTADSHYPRPELWKERQIYKSIGWMKKSSSEELLASLDPDRESLKGEYYPKNGEQMWDAYQKYSGELGYTYDDDFIRSTIERTHQISSEKITEFVMDSTPKLPDFVVPEGKTPEDTLRELSLKGLKDKGKDTDIEYVERLNNELEVIEYRGFAKYFITMKAIIDLAKDTQLIGPGRGSAAGSLVAYVLEITQADPIKYGLLFSRFLRRDANDYPDIDVDFGYNMELKNLLIEKWGADTVVPITNFNTLKLRSLIKDLSKLYGIPFMEVNKVTSMMEEEATPGAKKERGMKAGHIVPTFEELMKHSPSLISFMKKHSQIASHVKVLHGQVRSIARHAGGVVIADNLNNHMPLISSKGITQTPWSEGQNVRHLEPMGFIKFDILALDALKMFDSCINTILKRKHGIVEPTFAQRLKFYNNNLHPDVMDMKDQKVFENVFHKGKWVGIFQFTESVAQELCSASKPRSIVDISAVTSIVRPGPLEANVHKSYLKAKKSPRSVRYLNKIVEEVTKETSGFLIFQEQIALLAHKLGKGISLDEGNTLRKLLTKKGVASIEEKKEKIRKKFVAGCLEKNISNKDSSDLWKTFEFFSGYGFNKSHAVCYSMISYQCAWLMTYHEPEWIAAFLDKEPDSRKEKAISLARTMGYEIVNPTINHSGFKWEPLDIDGVTKLVQPLSSIKGLGVTAISQILEHRPFNTIEETLFNDKISYRAFNKKAFDVLCRSGAMDSLMDYRFTGSKHFWTVVAANKPTKKQQKIFKENIVVFAGEGDFSRDEQIENILSLTGFYPIALVAGQESLDKLEECGIPPLGEFDRDLQVAWCIPREITVRKTKNGKTYWIVKVTDSTNTMIDIKCWGIRPVLDSLKLNAIYIVNPKFEQSWGFSTSSISAQWKKL